MKKELIKVILGGLLPFSFNVLAAKTKELPPECKKSCQTRYGLFLGVTQDGVEAFSNCSSECVVFDPHRYQGTYTGIKWQCVEYARRWLLVTRGVVYGSVDYAYEIWDKISELSSPKGEKKISLQNINNGEIRNLKKGDLIIWSKDYKNTGHIAVVLEYDQKKMEIKVAEENYLNKVWPEDYARKIKIKKIKTGLKIDEKFVLGIKRME